MAFSNLDILVERLKRRLSEDETLGVIDDLLSLVSGHSGLYNEVLLHKNRYARVELDERKGLLTAEEARVEKNRIINALLRLLDELPSRLSQADRPVESARPSSRAPSSAVKLDKIIGINNLKQISWVARGVHCARSVCRVLTPKGLGTGFLIAPDIVMTNHHVIPSSAVASQTQVEFNYQIAFDGSFESTCRYRLDPEMFCTDRELDFSLVKVQSGIHSPSLSQWGYLMLNPNADPIPGEHVSIIQHPNGGLKQIVMTNNQVVEVRAPYVWYAADTMGGSSGSPVFNDQWQVIALHHAAADNGYNEGILVSHIKQRAEELGCWPPAQS